MPIVPWSACGWRSWAKWLACQSAKRSNCFALTAPWSLRSPISRRPWSWLEKTICLWPISASCSTRRRDGAEEGELRVVTETELWQYLGFVEGEQNVHRLYTPAMLADLLGLPLSVIRRWHRRGLIQPARQVRRLPYFDFQEVATARRLAELLASGMSPAAIEKKLAELTRLLPGVARPLAQLSVIVEGKHLLLRQGDGLIEPGGQLRFDFEAGAAEPAAFGRGHEAGVTSSAEPEELEQSPEMLRELAARLEDAGELEQAVEAYRTALAAGGPQAETCFLLAELLYRIGDVPAARERYYMALELDEDYVEARANLGCVLAETGRSDLALAAFRRGAAIIIPIILTRTIIWPACSTIWVEETRPKATGDSSCRMPRIAPGPSTLGSAYRSTAERYTARFAEDLTRSWRWFSDNIDSAVSLAVGLQIKSNSVSCTLLR